MIRKIIDYSAFTLLFWFCALMIGGLIAVLHGDCFADEACTAQKQHLSIAVIAIAAIAYIFALRRFAKKRGTGRS